MTRDDLHKRIIELNFEALSNFQLLFPLIR